MTNIDVDTNKGRKRIEKKRKKSQKSKWISRLLKEAVAEKWLRPKHSVALETRAAE